MSSSFLYDSDRPNARYIHRSAPTHHAQGPFLAESCIHTAVKGRHINVVSLRLVFCLLYQFILPRYKRILPFPKSPKKSTDGIVLYTFGMIDMLFWHDNAPCSKGSLQQHALSI